MSCNATVSNPHTALLETPDLVTSSNRKLLSSAQGFRQQCCVQVLPEMSKPALVHDMKCWTPGPGRGLAC